MLAHCLDLELLRTFVGIVECGGFTRAGIRLNRSQSTISQQIKRLEDQVGRPLLNRDAPHAPTTEAGEILLGYARRILALDDEVRAVLVRRETQEIIRFGVSEDFAGRHLPKVLAAFGREHPQIRLDVRADLSINLQRDFDAGDLDVALFKRERPMAEAEGCWAEDLFWVGPQSEPMPPLAPIPLALFPLGCLFRAQATARLDAQNSPWRIAYVSPSLAGIQAAAAAGMAVSPMGRSGLTADLAVLDHRKLGLPDLSPIWFSLVMRKGGAARNALCETVAAQVGAVQKAG